MSTETIMSIVFVACFVIMTIVLVMLGRKGILSTDSFKIIKQISDTLAYVGNTVISIAPNEATATMNQVITLIEKAVYAAENMWYNAEIDKDQRNMACKIIFGDLLKANNITLTQEMSNVVDALIAATCEAMGHNEVDDVEEIVEVDPETVTNG